MSSICRYDNFDHPDLLFAFDMETHESTGVLRDMSGNGCHGTVEGTPLETDSIIPQKRVRGGKCLYFDGTDNGIEVDFTDDLTSATVVVFFRKTSINNRILVGKDNAWEYVYVVDKGPASYFIAPNEATGSRHGDIINRPQMIAVRMDPSYHGEQIIYPWKERVRTKSVGGGWDGGSASNFQIGNRPLKDLDWMGDIDNVLVFNRRLTDAEVDAIWQSAQYVISTKRTHDGLTVWDGVADGIWDATSRWKSYYTGSISKTVTPTDTGSNYMGQTGISDGRTIIGFPQLGTQVATPRPGQYNAVRGRIWLDGTPNHSGTSGKLDLYLGDGWVGTIRQYQVIGLTGLGPGWNEFDVKFSDFSNPGIIDTIDNLCFQLYNNTTHPTDPLTEIVVADLEFYKTSKTRYDFNSESELTDWTIRAAAGTVGYKVEESKLIIEPTAQDDEWYANVEGLSLKGDFRIRAKIGWTLATLGRWRFGLRYEDHATECKNRAITRTADGSTVGYHVGGGIYGGWVPSETANAQQEAIFEIVRRGGQIAMFINGTRLHRYDGNKNSFSDTVEVTKLGIGVDAQTAFTAGDKIWCDWIEWEEL